MNYEILKKRGILLNNMSICKDKINLVSGACVKPFAENIWITSAGDKDTINRITDVFVMLNNKNDQKKLFRLITALYALLGLKFPQEAECMDKHPEVMNYFLFSFLADFKDIIQDYLITEK